MKRSLFCFILFITSISLVHAQKRFTIKGQGFPPNEKIVLSSFDGASMKYVEVSHTKAQTDQSFQLKEKFIHANLYQLSWGEDQQMLLSVEKSKTITLIRSEEGIKIEGSEKSARMQSFGGEIQALQGQYFGTLKPQLDKAMAEGDKEKAQALMKKANDLLPQFVQDLRAKINAMGVSPAGYFAIQFSDFNKEQAYTQERLALFEKDLPNSPVTKALRQQVEQASATAVGKVPPAISALNRNAEKISLDDFKGKLLLVDFWASWCRACRVENPKFVELYNQFHEQNFDILSISSDEKKEAWEKAIQKDGVALWNQILDENGAIFNLYGVSSLPQNIVLSPAGKVIAKNVDAEQLEALLKEQLSSK